MVDSIVSSTLQRRKMKLREERCSNTPKVQQLEVAELGF